MICASRCSSETALGLVTGASDGVSSVEWCTYTTSAAISAATTPNDKVIRTHIGALRRPTGAGGGRPERFPTAGTGPAYRRVVIHLPSPTSTRAALRPLT